VIATARWHLRGLEASALGIIGIGAWLAVLSLFAVPVVFGPEAIIRGVIATVQRHPRGLEAIVLGSIGTGAWVAIFSWFRRVVIGSPDYWWTVLAVIAVIIVAVGGLIIGTAIGEARLPPGAQPEFTTRSGLRYKDVKVGTGTEAKAGDTVTVHYIGRLEDGRTFASSVDRDEPFSFRLGAGKVIKGWDEGVAGMKEGGKRKLIIPPELGYGARGAGTIPPNAVLIFDVELLKVQ
jgi:FKBP-type peptidyl-prolyl cis-trans isomerase FkpA